MPFRQLRRLFMTNGFLWKFKTMYTSAACYYEYHVNGFVKVTKCFLFLFHILIQCFWYFLSFDAERSHSQSNQIKWFEKQPQVTFQSTHLKKGKTNPIYKQQKNPINRGGKGTNPISRGKRKQVDKQGKQMRQVESLTFPSIDSANKEKE